MQQLTACAASSGRRINHGTRVGEIVNRAVIVTDAASSEMWMVIQSTVGSPIVCECDRVTKFPTSAWYTNEGGYATGHAVGGIVYMHSLVLPSSPGLSVDHVNWIKVDNRAANLRLATLAEQNANRADRVDKAPPCAELLGAGITRLPRGIRKDRVTDRYTCGDHPLLTGQYNGTRHMGSGETARYKDCLETYVELLGSHPANAQSHALAERRVSLAAEYNAIVRCAHEFDTRMPDGPYADLRDLMDDLSLARHQLALLADVRVVKGPQTQAIGSVRDPAGLAGVVARVKGATLTLYDARFEHALGELNWETDGVPRVHIPKALERKYPGVHGARMLLSHFVWTVLAGRAVPEGCSVAHINGKAFDVRLENLAIRPGAKAPRSIETDLTMPADAARQTGMRFLPRGMSVNQTKVMLNQAAGLHAGEHGADAKGLWKASINAARSNVAELVLRGIRVLRDTHSDAKFDEDNARYQRLLGGYADCCAELL